MHNSIDIRDRPLLAGSDARQRKFINELPDCHLRKHHRQGLRSVIFEVLAPDDVLKETEGEIIDGTRWFPRAVPKYMLRIFRTRFSTIDQVIGEINKYALLFEYLGPDLIARSEEFIVEYTETGRREIVLCGLQEYVDGVILDPWRLSDQGPLDTFCRANFHDENPEKNLASKAYESIARFVRRTRRMIIHTGYIPDLAGNGNLIMTSMGGIKLVDINNIIRIDQNDAILLDDQKYPSCDKSVEVLAIFDQKILKNENIEEDPLYGHFLSEERRNRVRRLENEFYRNLSASTAV